jgi:hypothetical protein
VLLHEEREYAVDVLEGDTERRAARGLDHAEAMAYAERLQRDGKIVRVMHMVGATGHEVDRYPPR